MTPEEFWWWHVQHKAYMHLTGTTWGILAVLYINGHYYKVPEGSPYGPMEPVAEVYRVFHTKQELRDNWATLLGNKVTIEDGLERKTTPPGAMLKGICGGCPYQDKLWGTEELGRRGMGFKTFPCDGLAKAFRDGAVQGITR